MPLKLVEGLIDRVEPGLHGSSWIGFVKKSTSVAEPPASIKNALEPSDTQEAADTEPSTSAVWSRAHVHAGTVLGPRLENPEKI